MARMDKPNEENQLVKLLLIGDGKIGKTYYAGMAAAAGFNVFYIDGDVGSQTLVTLPLEARERIYHANFADHSVGGVNDSRFIDTMLDFALATTFNWNADKDEPLRKADASGELWQVRPARMDSSSVLVIDSWTGLSESIMQACARAEGVDLPKATTSEMRPVYGGGANKATQILKMIRSARCHVIVIAHPDEFQHKTAPEGRKVRDVKEIDMVIDWTKMIPKSTSRPHGLQMAKYFTDVAWMETNATGTQRLLNFRMNPDRVSGGHFNDMKDAFSTYSFGKLVEQIGGKLPSLPNSTEPWLTVSRIEDTVATESATAPVLQQTEQPKSIGGFLKKA